MSDDMRIWMEEQGVEAAVGGPLHAAQLVLHVALAAGTKSLTHMGTALTRYQPLMASFLGPQAGSAAGPGLIDKYAQPCCTLHFLLPSLRHKFVESDWPLIGPSCAADDWHYNMVGGYSLVLEWDFEAGAMRAYKWTTTYFGGLHCLYKTVTRIASVDANV